MFASFHRNELGRDMFVHTLAPRWVLCVGPHITEMPKALFMKHSGMLFQPAPDDWHAWLTAEGQFQWTRPRSPAASTWAVFFFGAFFYILDDLKKKNHIADIQYIYFRAIPHLRGNYIWRFISVFKRIFWGAIKSFIHFLFFFFCCTRAGPVPVLCE